MFCSVAGVTKASTRLRTGAEARAQQPIPRSVDFFTITRRQILIILPIDIITPVLQHLNQHRPHLLGGCRQCDINNVWFMRDRRAGTGNSGDDERGNQEVQGLRGHLALLSFN